MTQESLRDRGGGPGVPLVSLDGRARALAAEEGTNPASGAAPGNLAYVIYTSGSTGRPKGVAIEHRSAAALVRWAAIGLLGPGALRVLASTSVCFDLSIFEMFVPLTGAAPVVVAGERSSSCPRLDGTGDVTLVNTVPSVMAELAPDSASLPPLGEHGQPRRRAALQPCCVDRLYEQPGVAQVYDLYGPTETTTYSTFTLRRRGRARDDRAPDREPRAYVLDPDAQPVPIGVAGELFIGGAGAGARVPDRPELTAERFVPDPFSGPGARLYRTGDLAAGGRTDSSSISAASTTRSSSAASASSWARSRPRFAGIPRCEDVAVVVREDGEDERRLVAYVVAGAERAGARRRAARPDCARPSPSTWSPRPSSSSTRFPSPRTARWTRGRCPRPPPAAESARAHVAAPTDPCRRPWPPSGRTCSASRASALTTTSSTSAATRCSRRDSWAGCTSTFAVDVPLRSLFQQPTVAGLADVIQALQWIAESGRATATGKREEVELDPLELLARLRRPAG